MAPAEPPTSREIDHGRCSAEAGTERANTDDSCEREGPVTPTPVREEAAESHLPPEAKPPPPPRMAGGGREDPTIAMRETPSDFSHAPLTEGWEDEEEA